MEITIKREEEAHNLIFTELYPTLALIKEKKMEDHKTEGKRKKKRSHTQRKKFISKRQTSFLFVFFNRDCFLVVLFHFLILPASFCTTAPFLFSTDSPSDRATA
jgi:hypothetical protein